MSCSIHLGLMHPPWHEFRRCWTDRYAVAQCSAQQEVRKVCSDPANVAIIVLVDANEKLVPVPETNPARCTHNVCLVAVISARERKVMHGTRSTALFNGF
jgi:hypothetical protein